MIEAYADQAAFDAHMKIPLVQDMIKWMGGPEPVLEGAPTVLELDIVEDFGLFTRPEGVAATSDPYVVVAEVSYKDGELVEKSFAHWRKVVDTTKADEPGSLVYALARNPAEPAKLYSFEAYESKEYLWETHAKSQAVQGNVAATKDWRAGLKHHIVKQVQGFLTRSKI